MAANSIPATASNVSADTAMTNANPKKRKANDGDAAGKRECVSLQPMIHLAQLRC
jgi:hypothetical protein